MTSGLEDQFGQWPDARDQAGEGKPALSGRRSESDGPPYCAVVYDQRVVKTRLLAGHHGIYESPWTLEAIAERNLADTRI